MDQSRNGSAPDALAVAAPVESDSSAPTGIEGIYVERVFAMLLLLALTLGCVVILRPFFSALLWAVILAISTWPIYTRLERKLHGRRTLAALLMTLGAAIVLLLPITLLGVRLGDSAASVVRIASVGLESGFPPLPEWLTGLPFIGTRLQEFWARTSHDKVALAEAIRPHLPLVRDWLIARGGDLLGAIAEIAISLLVAFFLYRDGVASAAILSRIMTRLAGLRAGRLLEAARSTIVGVVQGVMGTALVQAICMGLGFWLAGVPLPLFLGIVSFFLSLVPLGLGLLWIPAALWLMSQDQTGWAAFTGAWGLFVGTIDNWLRPALIQQRSTLPLVLILLGVLGGALTFGFLGLFLGPVLLAVGFILIHEWGSPPAELREPTA